MMSAPYRRYLALGTLLAATMLLKSIVFAQGVATIVQTVKPADSGLTWQPPAALPFGTPVSNMQLNATAATPGTFTYVPAAGTILPPGPNTLSVSFKPDNPNFLAGTLTVPITVLPSAVPGFSFALALASTAQGPFVLRSGKTAPIHFTVARVLNFDQTVTFTCSTPMEDVVCAFTPATSPLLEQPLDVSLVVQLVSKRSRKERGSVSQDRGRGIPVSGLPYGPVLLTSSLLAATLFGTGFRRGRLLLREGRYLATMLAITLSGVLLGCGSRRPFETSQQLLIVATSPYESHSVEITVVRDEDGGGGSETGRRPPIDR